MYLLPGSQIFFPSTDILQNFKNIFSKFNPQSLQYYTYYTYLFVSEQTALRISATVSHLFHRVHVHAKR